VDIDLFATSPVGVTKNIQNYFPIAYHLKQNLPDTFTLFGAWSSSSLWIEVLASGVIAARLPAGWRLGVLLLNGVSLSDSEHSRSCSSICLTSLSFFVLGVSTE
jgi:hypothetical protein